MNLLKNYVIFCSPSETSNNTESEEANETVWSITGKVYFLDRESHYTYF